MSKLLVASLITLAAVAADSPEVAARRIPIQPPPIARCDAHAPVLASIIGHFANANPSDPNAVAGDWLFSVRGSGRWDFATVDPQTHVVGDAVNGCIDAPATDKLRATLRAAPWKATPVVHCMAVSAATTEYSINGKLVWTAQMCQPNKLDTVSANAIAALDELVANARKPAAAPPPVADTPPATCAYGDKPIFEQQLVLSDASRTQLTVAVYAGGGWTRLWEDSKQKPDQSRGCLSEAALASVKADLKAAPWSITRARLTCRMFSPEHTIYRIDGKQMFDRHVCGADSVDAATEKSLAHIKDTLAPFVQLTR